MNETEKLVTLAIHSTEIAQSVQLELLSHGIKSEISPVGGEIAGDYVRVRVIESDLPAAARIEDEMRTNYEVKQAVKAESNNGCLLVPIDFSSYSEKNIRIAFHLARCYGCQVTLLHAYEAAPRGNLIEDFLTGQTLLKGQSLLTGQASTKREKETEQIINEAIKNRDELSEKLQSMIAKKELPNVNYSFSIKEGIPEEVILEHSRAIQPILIIMGTHGSNKKSPNLIGSVTAEVIERSKVPVFTVSENTTLNSFEDIKNIAYATRFENEDQMAFEQLMRLMKPFKIKVHIFHLPSEAEWDEKEDYEKLVRNEIMLNGTRDYFKKKYPDLETEVHMVEKDNTLQTLDQFVQENNIDVISMNTHRRSLFVRLFNPSVAKRMIFHTDTSMLVFHS